jgi:translation initiation factor IF-2
VITRRDRSEVAGALAAVTGPARSAGAGVAENTKAAVGDAVQSVSSALETGVVVLAEQGRRARKRAKAEADARRKQIRKQSRKARKQVRKARRRGERALAVAKVQAAERAGGAASRVRRQKPATSRKRMAGRVLLFAAATAVAAQLVRRKLAAAAPPSSRSWNQPPRQSAHREPATASDSS